MTDNKKPVYYVNEIYFDALVATGVSEGLIEKMLLSVS